MFQIRREDPWEVSALVIKEIIMQAREFVPVNMVVGSDNNYILRHCKSII
jgi:hypothetical protein